MFFSRPDSISLVKSSSLHWFFHPSQGKRGKKKWEAFSKAIVKHLWNSKGGKCEHQWDAFLKPSPIRGSIAKAELAEKLVTKKTTWNYMEQWGHLTSDHTYSLLLSSQMTSAYHVIVFPEMPVSSLPKIIPALCKPELYFSHSESKSST